MAEWTHDEDVLLAARVASEEFETWEEVAAGIPGRSPGSTRKRWYRIEAEYTSSQSDEVPGEHEPVVEIDGRGTIVSNAFA